MNKNNTENTRFWVRVSVVGIVFAVTSFLIALDMSKEYKSSVLVLVRANNEISSSQMDKIVWNVSEFPKMLSFYERLLKTNPEIKDAFAGKARDQKKILWNEKIEVAIENSGETSIIRIGAIEKKYKDSEMLIGKVTKNLIEMTSGYYDAENVSLSVVDGPFVSAVSRSYLISISLSLLVGALASLLLNVFLQSLENLVIPIKLKKYASWEDNRSSEDYPISKPSYPLEVKEDGYNYDVPYSFNGTSDQEKESEEEQLPEWLGEEMRYIFKDNPYPNYPEMPANPKQASAPDNLPIAEMENNPQVEKKEEVSFMEMKSNEPTDEELKARLNKLLRGDL